MNQIISIHLKTPPNPNPDSTLAAFQLPIDISLLHTFLSGIADLPKDAEFIQNVREEAMKAISNGVIVAVYRKNNLLTIQVKEQ